MGIRSRAQGSCGGTQLPASTGSEPPTNGIISIALLESPHELTPPLDLETETSEPGKESRVDTVARGQVPAASFQDDSLNAISLQIIRDIPSPHPAPVHYVLPTDPFKRL